MKKKINISLDEEVIKAIKKLAKERHSNFSATINQLLWEKVNGTGEYIAEAVGEIAEKMEPLLKKYIEEKQKKNAKTKS